MNKNSLIGLSFVAIGALCFWVGLSPASNPPEDAGPLVAESSEINIGPQNEGEHQSSFRLRNRSNEPLEVINIRKSCRCNRINMPSKTILPGEEVEVGVDWDLRGQAGSTTTALLFNYKVSPDGERVYSTKVSLVAEVEPDFWLTPSQIRLGQGQPTATLTMTPDQMPDARILTARCAHPGIEARLSSPRTINVILNEKHEIVDKDIFVEIETNSQNSGRKIIPVSIVDPR